MALVAYVTSPFLSTLANWWPKLVPSSILIFVDQNMANVETFSGDTTGIEADFFLPSYGMVPAI
jgi:hypothetical protein